MGLYFKSQAIWKFDCIKLIYKKDFYNFVIFEAMCRFNEEDNFLFLREAKHYDVQELVLVRTV